MSSDTPVVLGRVAGSQWIIEATLFAWNDSRTTLLTTRNRRGTRAVGIEITPSDASEDFLPAMREEWSRRWMARLHRMHQEALATLVPLPSALDVGPLLEALDRYERGRRGLSNFGELSIWEDTRMSPDYAAAVTDAQIYAYATAAAESAAEVLAEHHQITRRSAEGRIRRARQRGLLSTPPSTRTPSLLTEKGALAIEALTGERPYPYLTEEGEVVHQPNK